jgi:hypothetical protein
MSCLIQPVNRASLRQGMSVARVESARLDSSPASPNLLPSRTTGASQKPASQPATQPPSKQARATHRLYCCVRVKPGYLMLEMRPNLAILLQDSRVGYRA